MPAIRIAKEFNDEMYFSTFTVKNWYYIFDRHNRWDILTESLKYCQENKNLKVYSYVFMLNHMHLIFKCPDGAGFVRDFKKYTSYELIKNLRKTEPTVAKLFEYKKDKNGKYNIWDNTNMPKMIETEYFFWQKKEYIEYNPVEKGYVQYPEHWINSSAFPLSPIKITETEL